MMVLNQMEPAMQRALIAMQALEQCHITNPRISVEKIDAATIGAYDCPV